MSSLRRAAPTGSSEAAAYNAPVPEPAVDPSLTGDERTTLAAFLDEQRSVLAWKCQGLSEAQLKELAVPPSRLSLLGLVRHMAEVERHWFRRGLNGERLGRIWGGDDQPEAPFELVSDAEVGLAFSTWEEECRISREILGQLDSLDRTFSAPHYPVISARCMINHMIEEYSRHNGHADLLRERIDGATGAFPPEVGPP